MVTYENPKVIRKPLAAFPACWPDRQGRVTSAWMPFRRWFRLVQILAWFQSRSHQSLGSRSPGSFGLPRFRDDRDARFRRRATGPFPARDFRRTAVSYPVVKGLLTRSAR